MIDMANTTHGIETWRAERAVCTCTCEDVHTILKSSVKELQKELIRQKGITYQRIKDITEEALW